MTEHAADAVAAHDPRSRPLHLVQSMGTDLVEPDWPPLEADEVVQVLSRFVLPSGDGAARRGCAITWLSPRPMSAAALVEAAGATVFVKRHHKSVRSGGQLGAEHAFAEHLRSCGVVVPAPLRTRTGASLLVRRAFIYEVQLGAPGIDCYRDAPSWTGYANLGHARAAGAALGRFHRAARSFARPARPFGVLTGSSAIVRAEDPIEAVRQLSARRPGLRTALAGRAVEEDLARELLAFVSLARPQLLALERQWGHGDWHGSNLTWSDAGRSGEVVSAFDLGLANRTSAVHDLCVALERSMVSWLSLAETGRAAADLEATTAFLAGYDATRRLRPAERAALANVLPICHVEFALSELEYFAAVVGSKANADLAYDGYLLGHLAWFSSDEGSGLLEHLRRWSRS